MENLDALDKAFGEAKGKQLGGFDIFPENTKVKAVIISQKSVQLGTEQTAAVDTEWEIMEPAEVKGIKTKGKKIFGHKFWFTTKNIEYLKGNLITLDWPGTKDGRKVTSLLRNEDKSLIGLGAEIQLGVESYQEKDKQTKELVFEANPDRPGEMRPKMRWKNIIKFITGPFKYTGTITPKDGGSPDTASPTDPDSDIPF